MKTLPQQFIDSLGYQLRALSSVQQMAFGAICCTWHLSDYNAFSVQEGWGNPEILQRAIDLTWNTVADPLNPEARDPSRLLAECVSATPNSDDFPSAQATYAQDEAIMVSYLVEFLQTRDPKAILEIASKARDLVDAQIQITSGLSPTDPNLEDKIAGHPLMIAELTRIRKALEAVSQQSIPSVLSELRQLQN